MHNCPICKKEIKGKEENYLVPNWGLQVAVDSYREMRGMLYRNIQQGQANEKTLNGLTVGSDSQTFVEKDDNYCQESCKVDINDSQRACQAETEKECPSSKRPRRNCRLSHSTYKEENIDDGKDEDVEINKRAPFKAIPHSTMTNSNVITKSIIQPNQNMKRIPPFRFHGTKKNQLIRWCQDNGLPTNGSDDDRKWRLKNYADLWNAECDSMKPRSKGELIRVLRTREQSEKVSSICYLRISMNEPWYFSTQQTRDLLFIFAECKQTYELQ